MTTFDDFGARYRDRFRMFATAVAGERALAAAAGLPPGSIKQWSRAHQFKDALLKDFQTEAIRYFQDHLAKADEPFRKRGMAMMGHTYLEVARISSAVITQSVRQATFGKDNPLSALDVKRMGTGAIGLLAQRRLANPDFKVADTSGRQWTADTLVGTIVRDFAYQVLIDSQYDEAIRDGATEVTLEHPDPEHMLAGQTLPLTGDGWLALRDSTFHVNSNLTVTHASVSA